MNVDAAMLRLNGNISFLSAKNIAQAISSHQTPRTLIDASGIGSIDYAGFDDLKKVLKSREIVVCTTNQLTMETFYDFDPKVSIYLTLCQFLFKPFLDTIRWFSQ